LGRTAIVVFLASIVFCDSGCISSPDAKSARYLDAGKKLLAKHDASRAILQFLNALKATPRNPEVHYQLALAYLASGDLKRGVASLRKALELNPGHAAAQLCLARLETNANNPEVLKDAQQRLRTLLQQTPQDPEALHALALTELKLGIPEDAVGHLESALRAAPADLVIAVTLAEAKLDQNDYTGAEQVLKGACDRDPHSSDALVLLGRFYAIQKRYGEAEQTFQKALAITPDDTAALLNLATLQNQLGRKNEAEHTFRQLAASSDHNVNADYGIFLFQEGRKEEAIREFERLARQDPNDRMARTRLVAAYQASGRLPEGERILSDALKKNPRDLDALLQRSELLISAKKYADAKVSLNQVMQLKPDSPEVHYALAKFYQSTGKTQLYRQELNETLRFNPFLVSVRVEAARALIAGKEGGAALALLNGAPANQGDLLAIVEQRNWALLATRQEAEARKGVERGLATARTAELLLQDAVLKLASRRFPEARQAVHEALVKTPEDERALQLLVGSYIAENQVHQAVEAIRAYATQHVESPAIQLFLGRLLLATGDRMGAQKVIAAVKIAHPSFTAADLSLAQIDLLQAKWTDARQELNMILSTEGEAPIARQWLGMLEASAGNQAAAIESFRKVLETEPNNGTALNNLAFLLAENGKAAEALAYAEKAVSLAPDKPEFEDTLGWVFYRKGLFDAAVTHLQSAVAKGGDVRQQYHLAAAYFRKGDVAKGNAMLTAALRKNPSLPEALLAQQAARETQARHP
jgi:tetratricopeptide (TPR) repeat protein